MNKLLIVGLILVVAGLVAVPALAQVLPQGETGVTDPVGGGGSVPEDVTSTEPSSSTEQVGMPPTEGATNPAAPAEGGAANVIPIELSSELCADVTDPLVVGTFEQVLPEVVQGCQERASIPAGTAPVNPAPVESAPTNDKMPVKPAPTNDTVPAEPAPVEPAPIDTNPPNQATSVYP
jgi:hypothetical protein